MVKDKFDLVVIGGGTGGLRTALYSAGHGYKTALVEPGVLGGTCLNTGCIPTKAMLYASHLYMLSKNFEEFGIETGETRVDFGKLMTRVKGIIDEGQEHIANSIKNENLILIKSKGGFVGKNQIKTENGVIEGKKIVICTGAKSHVPAIKGLEKVKFLISDDVLNLKNLPKSIIIFGGGYIAVEFSTFFNDLRTRVIILERNEQILHKIDKEAAEVIRKEYEKRGIEIHTGIEIKETREENGAKKVIFTGGREKKEKIVSADEILVATGRIPNTFGLNLEVAGIEKDKKENIKFNKYLQTTNKNVYVLGDVTGRTMFAHAAKRESHIVLVNALENKKEIMNFELVPWAIFSEPPIAGVGIAGDEVKNIKDIGILKAAFSRAGRARVIGNTGGFAKVFYNKRTQIILGAIIIGPRADEIIHEFTALMNSKGTIDEMRNTIHIHPTLSEVIEALKEV
ncbi:dihydrolipoyl dehydrogenase [Candidatus Pacearchaeota archaeon]|nr:dihydrolipoyl dehydrogenase [Candidatus Pacearchaeota archaeon]